jgi:hypothetical protein
MHRISEPISLYQCFRSNEIFYEARKVIFQNDKDDKDDKDDKNDKNDKDDKND